jgi:hypothetical protein
MLYSFFRLTSLYYDFVLESDADIWIHFFYSSFISAIIPYIVILTSVWKQIINVLCLFNIYF